MSAAVSTLPATKEIRDLLLDLLGRNVEVRDCPAWAPLPHEGACVGEYVDDTGKVLVLAMADIGFAGYVGACLGLVPPGGAQDMVAEKSLSPMVVDNLYEVLNILTSVFNKPDLPHVKITVMHGPGGPLPADLTAVSRRLAGRLDLEVNVAGYGKGRLALVLA